MRGQTCERLGFGPGSLGCNSNCDYDLSGCTPAEHCGNGTVDDTEQCDEGDDNSDVTPDACRVNLVLAPDSWSNFVNTTAPTGASVYLDGSLLPSGTPVGDSGYSVTEAQLSSEGVGNHVIEATARVGVSVYGFACNAPNDCPASYWCPAGLDLPEL